MLLRFESTCLGHAHITRLRQARILLLNNSCRLQQVFFVKLAHQFVLLSVIVIIISIIEVETMVHASLLGNLSKQLVLFNQLSSVFVIQVVLILTSHSSHHRLIPLNLGQLFCRG